MRLPLPLPSVKRRVYCLGLVFPTPGSLRKKTGSRIWSATFKKPTQKDLSKKGELNSPHTIIKIDKTNPGFIAVFGAGILREPFLKKFSNRLFNLHIGDPEIYRGSSCSFWPIYQGKLQHMSATIHRIDQGVDTGDILSKQTITMSKEDNEQTLLLKSLKLGTKLMTKTIKNWQIGTLQSIPQKRSGKLYKKADFTPKAVLKVKQMVESGRLKNFIQEEMRNSFAGIEF